MTDLSNPYMAKKQSFGTVALRWLLYLFLGLFVVYYLMPLFVMVTTSLKSLEEIRTGSLVALPRASSVSASERTSQPSHLGGGVLRWCPVSGQSLGSQTFRSRTAFGNGVRTEV